MEIGNLSISLGDIHGLVGLHVRGDFYDEVVPTAKELMGEFTAIFPIHYVYSGIRCYLLTYFYSRIKTVRAQRVKYAGEGLLLSGPHLQSLSYQEIPLHHQVILKINLKEQEPISERSIDTPKQPSSPNQDIIFDETIPIKGNEIIFSLSCSNEDYSGQWQLQKRLKVLDLDNISINSHFFEDVLCSTLLLGDLGQYLANLEKEVLATSSGTAGSVKEVNPFNFPEANSTPHSSGNSVHLLEINSDVDILIGDMKKFVQDTLTLGSLLKLCFEDSSNYAHVKSTYA
ncbi:hypothetical protein BUALT_Bualt02G0056800 [Buddleja alternifolia]|uniref:Uncharacterized protein n=1 Tax=Buddleja alternifolia TaxID=168488 RepID=A0AAV6Y8W9_9LAMI|nr:hypothetical protein BUALT_Bualt02G0056800 [Buddleja alternifolia]